MESYSSHHFDFQAEPEPEPPKKGTERNTSNDTSSHPSAGGKPSSHDSSSPPGENEEERSWTSLTLPGAILNSTIYVIGKTIEFLAPYWPTSEQRHKVQTWARAHPVLTSFVTMEAMFVLVPIVAFAAFVAALAVLVVGGAVLFVVGVGLGVGVMMFIPGVLVAAGWAAVVWACAYVGFRAAVGAWAVYKSSPYYQHLSQKDNTETEKKRKEYKPQQQRTEPKPKQKENGLGYRNNKHEGGYLSPEESDSSSTVKVEPGYGDEGSNDEGRVMRGYADVVKDGERDEDKVGRDISRSLG